MVGFLNAASSGFDGSLMGGINAMEQYLDYVSSLSPIPIYIPLTFRPPTVRLRVDRSFNGE